jgi:hypothetical protein
MRINLCLFALVLLAVVAISQGFPFVSGQYRILYGAVYSANTGMPLVATVTVTRCGDAQTTTSASDGSWQLSYPYGTLGTITFSAPSYISESFQVGLNAQWYDAGGIISLQP